MSAIAVTSLALVDRTLEGGTPAFSSWTPPQGVSIELTTPLKPPMLTVKWAGAHLFGSSELSQTLWTPAA